MTITKPEYMSFEYEQSKERFILRHRHYRNLGKILLFMWTIYYSIRMLLIFYFWILYDDSSISSLTFGIPIVILIGILFLYSCRITWTLDANGLKRKFDTIFFSFIKYFPFHELLSIKYSIDNSQYDSQVIAETVCGNIVILNSMFRKVTIEECQWLARSMQEILLTLQVKQNGLLKETVPPSKTRWNIHCGDKYFEIICIGNWQVVPIIITTSLLFLTGFIYTIIMLRHCHILLNITPNVGWGDITPDVGWGWWKKILLLIVVGFFCFTPLIITCFGLWCNAIRKIRWTFTDSQIIRRTSFLGLGYSQYITMNPPCSIMIRKCVPNKYFYYNYRFNFFFSEGDKEIIITNKITKQKISLKNMTNTEANWLQEKILQNCNRERMIVQKTI